MKLPNPAPANDNASYDWDTKLAEGQAGERLLASLATGLVFPATASREYDLLVKSTGEKVEVKSDQYQHDKTPNFFFEKTSHGKPGGPWRALGHGVDWFCYFFPLPSPRAYWFRTPELVKALDAWLAEKTRWVVNIRNKGWSAQGYRVPRRAVAEVCFRVDNYAT